MILRELLLKLGLEVDEAAIAKGNLAAELLKKGLEKVVEVAQETIHKFVEMIEKTAEGGLEILELSKATGIATDTIQDLQTAAAFTGVTMDTLKTGLFSLSRNMYAAAQGSEESQKAFAKLGVRIKNSDGTLRGADDVLFDIADKFKEMPDGAEKLALSMQTLGKAGKGMVEMLSEGREGIEELAQETPNLTAEQLAASKEIIKTQKQIALTTENLWARAIGPLLPAINDLLKRYYAWKKAGAELMRQRIEKWVGLLIKLIGKTWDVVSALKEGLDAIVNTVGMFIGIIVKAAKGIKFLWDELIAVKLLLGAAVGGAGLIYLFGWLGTVAGQAAMRTAAAWALAAAPFIAIGAMIAAIVLIMDDLKAYSEGRGSLFGKVVAGIDKWLKIKPEDSPFMRGIKHFLQMLRDAVDVLIEIDDVFGDGTKKRQMQDRMAAKNTGQRQMETDAMTLDAARTRVQNGLPLTKAERAALARAGVPEGAFLKRYRGTRPEASVPAPEVRTSAATAGMSSSSSMSVQAPAVINVYPPAGSSPEAIGQAVSDKLESHWDDQIESAVAGTSY